MIIEDYVSPIEAGF